MYFSKWLGFRTLLTLAACLVLSLNASAQGGKGAIRGRVSDPSGGALIGAEIILQQNDASVVSDAQGQFFINNLEPGTYTVEISYVGFTAAKKDVVVVAGQTANVDAKLEVASVNLEVLVTAERAAGEVEEINPLSGGCQASASNVMKAKANMCRCVGQRRDSRTRLSMV